MLKNNFHLGSQQKLLLHKLPLVKNRPKRNLICQIYPPKQPEPLQIRQTGEILHNLVKLGQARVRWHMMPRQ